MGGSYPWSLSGVYLSTDNGSNWTQVGLPSDYKYITALTVSGATIYAGAYQSEGGRGVFRSTNNGTDWAQVNNGLTNTNVLSLTISGTYIFAGTSGAGVWSRSLSELPLPVELTSF